MEKTKIIIAGGREFKDYPLLKKEVHEFIFHKLDLEFKDKVEIVSGKAPGADSLGEEYAREMQYPVKEFPADWKTLGRTAGPVRNRQMAEYADACIVFWDGLSRGTQSMISEAKKAGIILSIIRY